MSKTYSDLILLPSFKERFEYLRISGEVGIATFGFDRYLNQKFYQSQEWRNVRNDVIIRDRGNDMGLEGYQISGPIRVHHMNPITIEDVKLGNPDIFDPEFLVATSLDTHNAIHFGPNDYGPVEFIERKVKVIEFYSKKDAYNK